MKTIASFGISRAEAMRCVFSLRRLYDTQSDKDGALARLIAFFKRDNPRLFKMSNIRLGRKADPFVASYYQEGIRYRLMKDGSVSVETADDLDDTSALEREMAEAVDAIIANEMAKMAAEALASEEGIAVGKRKEMAPKVPAGEEDVSGARARCAAVVAISAE